VGNDTGGALCQLVVAHHPERVARLVLTNCDSFENFPPALLRPLYRCARLPGIFGLLAQLFRAPFLQRAFFRTVAHRVPEPAVLAALFRPLRASADVRRDIAAFFAALRGDELLLAAPSFARFAGTVLVAWGTNDLFFPLRDARRLAAAFAGATCIEIADSRTFVSEDQPMVLAESIERFVGAPAAA
jgi:pimeloyl-ACP methyl ester carboxylesterase